MVPTRGASVAGMASQSVPGVSEVGTWPGWTWTSEQSIRKQVVFMIGVSAAGRNLGPGKLNGATGRNRHQQAVSADDQLQGPRTGGVGAWGCARGVQVGSQGARAPWAVPWAGRGCCGGWVTLTPKGKDSLRGKERTSVRMKVLSVPHDQRALEELLCFRQVACPPSSGTNHGHGFTGVN